MSEIESIAQFCGSKHLQQLPDLNSAENDDQAPQKTVEAGMQYGLCLLQDYILYKGVDEQDLQACLSRSNKAPQSTPESGAAGLSR